MNEVREIKFGEKKNLSGKIVWKRGIVGNERTDQEVGWRGERWLGRKRMVG